MSVTVLRQDLRFNVGTPDHMKRWWRATQDRANAMLQIEGGLRIYVSEPYAELAQHDAAHTFVRVHVVSSEETRHAEFERVINVPTLDRLIPVAKISAIAPIADEAP